MDIYDTLPTSIIKAFEMVYGASVDEEKVELFASHWGGLGSESFQRALAQGQGKDKVLAIFAIGYSGTAQAAEEIAPFMGSAQRMERWASALCLGAMKDAQAFPSLQRMLTEGLSLDARSWPQSQQEQWEEHTYDSYRLLVVPLLQEWDALSLIPTMRRAFLLIWEAEQAGHRHLFGYDYQDELAYALGQHRAFGVLTGLHLPPPHLKTAMVYIALGSLQARKHSSSEGDVMVNEMLQQEVAGVLEQTFGLAEEEQHDCIANFYKNSGARYSTQDNDEDDENTHEEHEREDVEDEEDVKSIVPVSTHIYHGHQARVNSLAWSTDGTHLVSGSEDTTVQFWEASTGKTIISFSGHTASVNVVAYSPHGRFVASGGSDTTARVWDTVTGKQVCTYQGHSSWICRGLSWSPDGSRIASGSWDRTVHIWDAFTGKTLLVYRGHEGIVYSVAWSPDGTRIASGGGYPECSIQVWDAESGRRQLLYRDHMQDGEKKREHQPPRFPDDNAWFHEASSVHSLAWSPDSTRLASAGLHAVTRVWEATTGTNIIASDRTCGPLAWSPDGAYLLSSAHGEEGVDLWTATTNELVVHYAPEGLIDVEALAWSPSGTHIAAAGQGRTVRVWRI